MSPLRILHVTAGFVALLVFIIPLVTKKGGRYHTRAGWVYVGAMVTVSLTAWTIAAGQLLDATSDRHTSAAFLGFLGVLSADVLWFGLRAVRFPARKERHKKSIDLFAPAITILLALGVIAIGIRSGNILLSAFPLLGVLLGAQQITYWRSVPEHKSHSVVAHISGMISAVIGTLTAFAVFGGPRLMGQQNAPVWLWIAPTIVLVPLIFYFQKSYKKS